MIELREVRKQFHRGAVAVDGISLSIAAGQIACIIGTSGCGKTTTLKMINRLIEPTSGDIVVNERLVREQDPIELRRSIGYVIQSAGLMPHLTLRDNVALLEKVKGVERRKRHARADALLDLVGLAPDMYGDRYPNALSGGQRQRVGIARALMSDPAVMLMDEPFGALDPITRRKMHDEFLALNKRLRKTIVVVTHDLEEAFKLGDMVVLMHKGRLVQQGTRDDFTNNPADDFVREFVVSHLSQPRESRREA
jgi:osmoprotectant transport system ATP-binding protein